MSSPAFLSISPLQYLDVAQPPPPLPALADTSSRASQSPAGVPEEIVQARIEEARRRERIEVEHRLADEWTTREARLRSCLGETVAAFDQQRAEYFRQVESEVVHLALAIARKILAREAQFDPMLLAGLVRIALDGLQTGPAATLHVAPAQLELWQSEAQNFAAHQVDVQPDATIGPDECVLKTEAGSARLSFDLQMKEVEQGFLDLLGRRPDRLNQPSRSNHGNHPDRS